MLKRFKILGWAFLAVGMVQSASAFSFYGPPEVWQTGALGYDGAIHYQDAPHNIGEEYRWNVPILYYTCDQSFLDFFGTKGQTEIDAAMAMINAPLANGVSSWSADLSEFPLEATQINYTAQALHLYDIRSFVFSLLVGHLSLTDPQAFTWTLRQRIPAPNCPNIDYSVVKRNFDPISWTPSVYVNGVLFTYWIDEFCPVVSAAITVPTPVDTAASQYTAVASFGLSYGNYYTSLTRDDAGGLRYLMYTNNVNLESSGGLGTTTYVTNNAASQLLYTSNLLSFAGVALSNSDLQLSALYPDAVFATPATSYLTNVYTTNIVGYTTNYPIDPIGTLPHLAFTTNVTRSVQPAYNHSYANLFIPEFVNGAWTLVQVSDISTLKRPAYATLQTINVSSGNTPFAAIGSTNIWTNTTSKVFITNAISGEFFFLPTNLCSLQILANQLTFTNSYTNIILSATNSAATNGVLSGGGGGTNAVGSTNVAYISQNLITYSTNHVFVVFPVTCPAGVISARQGMDKMQFVRRDYDSLINRYWTPITNTWSAVSVTNNTYFRETITRVIAQPDMLFTASDSVDTGTSLWRINPVFDTNGIPAFVEGVLDGPGTILPPGTGGAIIAYNFNKSAPIYQNFGPISMDEATAIMGYVWGSFDGTTNAPTIYPDATSLSNYQNSLVMQLFPLTLPGGKVGTPYSFSYVNNSSGVAYVSQFSGAGGQTPYTFSVTPGFVLPAGLTLQNDGTVGGSPTVANVYSFSIRMTDFGARYIDVPYTITVTPP